MCIRDRLKTPLTSISGFSEMISSGMVAKPEEVRRMAGIIHTEASRLIGLVCDIIRLSEIENLKGAGHDPVELSSVAEDAVRAVRGAAEKREVNLSCELEPVTTEGDRTCLLYTSRAVMTTVFPAAKSGIMAGIVLGIGRAIGETMAVIMVVGNQARLPSSILDGVRTLTTNIVLEMGYAEGLHREALIATGLVLFVFILLINLCFSLLNRRKEHE